MKEQKNIWPKQITVDKRIVRILSEQTYENFPNAIKELITNSYDADATSVSITFNEDNELMIIEDDGWGMSETEFQFYLRIAGHRREKSAKTPSGRYIIGQFGVGFLSVFPFFKVFKIETKKKNSKDVVHATIPCYQYFSSNRGIDISDIDIQGGISIDNNRASESYTRITLTGFTEICRNFFYGSHEYKSRKNSIHNYNSIDKFLWKLSEDLPISYKDPKYNVFTREFSPLLPFSVKFNDSEILRPVYGKTVLEEKKDTIQIGKIKVKYFIVTDKKSVTPNEARYLKIRNLNAGVGDRTNFGLGTEVGGARSRLHQLSGEIHIVEGLNDLITVSREGFNFSPDYEKMKEFFIKKLASLSNTLEDEAEWEDFVSTTKDESKIKNLSYLNPKKLQKKIEKISKSSSNKPKIETPSEFVKKIKLRNKSYVLHLEKWDIEEDEFPAVKIEKNKIFINNNYPLFKGVKYTDIFLKMHLLLSLHLLDKSISKSAYAKLVSEIPSIFDDYIK